MPCPYGLVIDGLYQVDGRLPYCHQPCEFKVIRKIEGWLFKTNWYGKRDLGWGLSSNKGSMQGGAKHGALCFQKHWQIGITQHKEPAKISSMMELSHESHRRVHIVWPSSLLCSSVKPRCLNRHLTTYKLNFQQVLYATVSR
jgi:hypothetical protein